MLNVFVPSISNENIASLLGNFFLEKKTAIWIIAYKKKQLNCCKGRCTSRSYKYMYVKRTQTSQELPFFDYSLTIPIELENKSIITN